VLCQVGLVGSAGRGGARTLAGGDGVARDAQAGHAAEHGGLRMLDHRQWVAAALRVVFERQ